MISQVEQILNESYPAKSDLEKISKDFNDKVIVLKKDFDSKLLKELAKANDEKNLDYLMLSSMTLKSIANQIDQYIKIIEKD